MKNRGYTHKPWFLANKRRKLVLTPVGVEKLCDWNDLLGASVTVAELVLWSQLSGDGRSRCRRLAEEPH